MRVNLAAQPASRERMRQWASTVVRYLAPCSRSRGSSVQGYTATRCRLLSVLVRVHRAAASIVSLLWRWW